MLICQHDDSFGAIYTLELCGRQGNFTVRMENAEVQ